VSASRRNPSQIVTRAPCAARDDQREIALLEEFARSPAVAALARVIAERRGPRANPKLLIEEARLSAATNDRVTQRN